MQNGIDPIITGFIKKHHLLTLATQSNGQPYCANCFYTLLEESVCLVFTSDPATRHGAECLASEKAAASIALETKNIAKIQGLQIIGAASLACGYDEKIAKKAYIKAFPFAALKLSPLWILRIDWMKMTDNRLGFGKKIIWERKAIKL
jgi:uncharacterized protein